jgi:hypothetical protein
MENFDVHVRELRREAGIASNHGDIDTLAAVQVQALQAVAKKRVDNVRTYMNAHGQTLRQPVKDKVEATLQSAENVLVQAASKLQTGAVIESVDLVKTGLQAVQDATLSLSEDVVVEEAVAETVPHLASPESPVASSAASVNETAQDQIELDAPAVDAIIPPTTLR